MAITKHYSGIVAKKGIDKDGAFIVLRHTNQYGTHDMEFSIEESALDLYHVDQVTTMTCEFHQPAREEYEYSVEIKSIHDRCEAGVDYFSNDVVSTLLVEIDRLAKMLYPVTTVSGNTHCSYCKLKLTPEWRDEEGNLVCKNLDSKGFKHIPVSGNGTEPPVCDCCGAGLMLDRGNFYDCFACGHNREKAEPKDDEGLDVVSILTNACQVFDGWHQDGTAWSEWDESVRKDLGELLAWFINANIKRSHFRAGAASHNGQGWEAKLRKLVADKEPNGYPLWFNRAVRACKDCDSEDCCDRHHAIAARDFTGCDEFVSQFMAALPAPPSEADGPQAKKDNQ